ncbi:MAG: aminotransferase class I/II-fold pyridoxal phosphate-dependent enzyme [Desulfobacterales bacterium]|jgi:LL-diaminopimelate aminotransferase
MKFSSRLQEVKRVHWHMVRKLINAKEAQGVKTISLASGNPDLPTPPSIVEVACQALRDPTYHRYPFSFQTRYGEAVASWYRDRFEVELNPATEVRPLAGSQEGIGNLALTVMEPGAIALITAPAYDSYARATRFAGGEAYLLPLQAENDFLPDLKAIPNDVLARARLLWLNYPNNPTGAVAPLSFFEDVVEFARRNDIWVCHDNAYSDVSFDGYKAPSFLAVEGAKEVGIELNTLSKAFNMAGWRLGMAVGHPELLDALSFVSFNTSMGLFGPSQIAAIEALATDQSWMLERNERYRKRRDILVDGLRAIGLKLQRPRATLYVWAKLPPAFSDSLEFSKWVLDQTGVWITSGIFFGPAGEGYVRASITLPADDLSEAMERLQTLKLH